MPKVRIKVEGLATMRANLNGSQLYENEWRKVFSQLIDLVYGQARTRAPRLSGKLQSGIAKKLDPNPMPLWGKVTVNAASARGFRYPFALEKGRRALAGRRTVKGLFGSTHRVRGRLSAESYVTLHYAGTRKGTRKWLSGSMRGFRKRAKVLLDWAAREIERKWGRK